MSGRRVTIVGAGLAGSLLACLLADRGWRVRVYEKRPDPRASGYLGGRSINLALSVRGLAGLREAALDDVVMRQDAIRMGGRMMHARDGALTYQPYSSDPADAINSVSRGGLNLTLIHAAAARPDVELFFGAPCLDVDFAAPAAVFSRQGEVERVESDLIVGTDGAFSAVRLAMMKTDRFEYSQSYLRHGYKELHIPAGGSHTQKNGGEAKFAMEPHALHIWPRGEAMMIALPNRDGSFTCTLFWPYEGEHSFARLEGSFGSRVTTPNEAQLRAVGAFFAEHYGDFPALSPGFAGDFFANPTSSLVTVRCEPWQLGGKVCILGDAAHAIVPFYGQGMNAAFEDCVCLARRLGQHHDQREALQAYQAERKPNADAIADMALENFIEMRDLAGRADFQYRKRIEQTLHKAMGDAVTPQYNLVSFSTVPYALAQQRGREMGVILREIAEVVPPGAEAASWERAVVEAGRARLSRITPIPAGGAS